jgi:hypothetical protein
MISSKDTVVAPQDDYQTPVAPTHLVDWALAKTGWVGGKNLNKQRCVNVAEQAARL